MLKFEWRLQKLLDLKNKQEDALRAELITVTEQAVGLRGQILMERTLLRQRLAETERMPAAGRMARQEFVLQFSQVTETAIRDMDRKLELLESVRRSKIQEILTVRKFRKGLEKLRTRAHEEFELDQQRKDQKQTDDRNSIGFARRIMQPV